MTAVTHLDFYKYRIYYMLDRSLRHAQISVFPSLSSPQVFIPGEEAI